MKKFFLSLLFVVNLVIIGMFWWFISGKLMLGSATLDTILIVLGRITGLVAVYFVLVQLMLIGRVKWIERTFGLDRLSIYHHWLGFGAVVLIILHFVFLVLGYARVYGATWSAQIWDFIRTGEELLPATVALVLFLVVVVGSITFVKKRVKYENWYYLHLLSYLAILLAFGHQLELGFDLSSNNLFAVYWVILYLFVGINFVIYRFFWQLWLFKKHQFRVSRIETETSDTISIYIGGKDIASFNFRAGQFAMFRFLDKKNWMQSHPYSFSAVPGKEYLRITVKALGDGSRDLRKISVGTSVLVDGPNGIFTEKRSGEDKIVLIAGGVGITPIRALAEHLADKNKNVVVLYSARAVDQIIFKNELDSLQSKNASNLKIHYIISEGENEYGFKMINQECIACLVPDVDTRIAYMCGPGGMMMAVKNQLINLGVNKNKIYYEKFSF